MNKIRTSTITTWTIPDLENFNTFIQSAIYSLHTEQNEIKNEYPLFQGLFTKFNSLNTKVLENIITKVSYQDLKGELGYTDYYKQVII
jgi:hypothetical protein